MPSGSVIAAESVTLLPVNPVMGTVQASRDAEATLVLRKNMFDWGTDYAVRDAEGQVVCVARAKPDSSLDKKQILGPDGRELYEIRDKVVALQRTMVGHGGAGDIFSVHNHHTKTHGDTTTVMRGWWKDHNGKHDISLQGDWSKGTAVLWRPDTNQALGKVLLQPVNLDSHWDKEEYVVSVAPGIDLQVFAGIIIAFETILAKELR